MTEYERRIARCIAGVGLAARSVETMPRTSIGESMERANAMMAALRIVGAQSFRPCFPFAMPSHWEGEPSRRASRTAMTPTGEILPEDSGKSSRRP